MIRKATIVRAGTAIRVETESRDFVVRLCDLPESFGRSTFQSARFIAVEPSGTGLRVEFADNQSAQLGLEGLRLPTLPTIVITNATLLTLHDGEGRLGVIDPGAIVLAGPTIQWVGRQDALPAFDRARAHVVDAGGRLVTPGLIDCHAHPMFAGHRADEFARRAAGETYREIAAAGGGIATSLMATRAAGLDAIVSGALGHLEHSLAHGTTTMEAKSGYALNVAGELKLLEAAAIADAIGKIDLVPTLLAHGVPPDRDDRTSFLDEFESALIPAVAKAQLARAVDVYCDEGALTLEEARTLLMAGKRHGLAVKAHAGQFSDLGAAELCASLGALSADHLEKLSDVGARALGQAAVVGVMLPGACVQLRLSPPPIERLRRAGVALAVASDFNPGSSMCATLPIQMWLAATHYGMTIEETWLGVTLHAARALALADRGYLAKGAASDVVVWDAHHPADVAYRYGQNSALAVIKAGRVMINKL